MSTLKNIRDKKTQTAFDKKALAAVQHLRSYINHRIYIAESTGIFPKNMFNANDIIDEGIAKFYNEGVNIDLDEMAIKLKLFKIVDNYLNELFKNEAFHQKTQSTSSILKKELNDLEEHYTVDADLDYVMNENLSDISYHQSDNKKQLFLYADSDTSVIQAFEMGDISPTQSGKLLGKFYTWLPINVSSIIDLYVFGKLNFEEISNIKNIEISRIEKVLNQVKKSFRKNLN